MRRAILAPVNARRLAGALCLALLLAPSQAVAQGGGVFVDPDSPTGKEYAIPLESARRQADPDAAALRDGSGVRQGTRSAPLFGEGIVAGAASAGRDGGPPGGRPGSAGEIDPEAAEGPSSQVPAAVRSGVENPGAPGGGVGTTALVGGVGIGILLVGGLAGYLVRRRSGA